MKEENIFEFAGVVKKHLGRGKSLGYPTANIDVSYSTPEGIFVGYVELDGEMLPSLIFVGAPITFEETDKKAEIYILKFNKNIYDKYLKIFVKKKLRENIKFAGQEALKNQIKKDEDQANTYFSVNNNKK